MQDNDWKEIPWASVALWCVAIGMAIFLLNWMGWISFKTWAPKYEDARRETFKHSVAHVEGKQQQLVRLWGEWKQANIEHQGALCAVARHEASTLSREQIPEIIQEWECVK